MALTPKQEAFAQAITSGKTQADAYRSSYNASRMQESTVYEKASRLMKTGNISARVAELRALVIERLTEKTSVDKAWVMAQLVEIVKMGKAAEPVTDAQGAAIGEYKTNLAASNRALELIGKEILMFIDRKEIKHSRLEEMNEEELDREISQKAREAGVSIQ